MAREVYFYIDSLIMCDVAPFHVRGIALYNCDIDFKGTEIRYV